MAAKSKTPSPAPRKTSAITHTALGAIVAVEGPPIPADRLGGEARTLVRVAEKHLPRLLKVGLDPSMLILLRESAEIMFAAQARLVIARTKERSAAEVKAEKDARRLRARALEDLEFALHGDADATAAIAAIREGEGIDDLVSDLRAVAGLVLERHAAVARIGLAPKEIAWTATDLAATLADLVARRRAVDEKPILAERDRAATLLVSVMTEIRRAGRYAFRDEPATARLFVSTYNRERRAVAKAKKTREHNKSNGTPVTNGASIPPA